MEIPYIIVQAGGKGTRMKQLTRNKPKALVPVQNLPMIFHLFRKYPKKKYIIIGDYKYEVLRRYLEAFADVDYQIINAGGRQGTLGGLDQALSYLPQGQAFMLIWSDLILPEHFKLPKEPGNYVGISKDFTCRWMYQNGHFKEHPSEEYGVAGLFVFQEPSVLKGIPNEGEFVRWLGESGIPFRELALSHTKEYGLLSEYEKLQPEMCRPFNRLTMQENLVIKEGIDLQGQELAVRERRWYEKLAEKKFANIPKIYALDPLTMEKVDGKNIYAYTDIPFAQKKAILSRIISCLKQIHALESVPADTESYLEAYIGKTYNRLEKVRNLVPFANDETVMINGRRCRNVFFVKKLLEEKIMRYMPQTFALLHGDCTFSNILLKHDQTPVLIDPRGYFGSTELYGDPAYDWVKLYYSIAGNYDQFNLKRFDLTICPREVLLQIESNHWEEMEQTFFELLQGEAGKEQMHLLHAVVWLSLTTYAWEDYDSICGAFYNGLYYLEEAL